MGTISLTARMGMIASPSHRRSTNAAHRQYLLVTNRTEPLENFSNRLQKITENRKCRIHIEMSVCKTSAWKNCAKSTPPQPTGATTPLPHVEITAKKQPRYARRLPGMQFEQADWSYTDIEQTTRSPPTSNNTRAV